jgi:hypothetical protein
MDRPSYNIADLTRVVGQLALSQKHLLTAQVVMADQLEKVAEAQVRTEQSLATMGASLTSVANSLSSFALNTQERISDLAEKTSDLTDRVNTLVGVVGPRPTAASIAQRFSPSFADSPSYHRTDQSS